LSSGSSTVYPQLKKAGGHILYEENPRKRKLSTVLSCLIITISNIIKEEERRIYKK